MMGRTTLHVWMSTADCNPQGISMPFHIAIAPMDVSVLLLYLAAVVLFGIWIGRGQRDMTGYLLGGRDLPWWAILGSIVATETSTATFLSVPGLAFAKGGDMRFLQLAFGMIIGRWLIVFLLLPLYFRGQLFTAYQVLYERFGGATKDVASVVFLVARNIGDGLRLFLTAIVLETVVGIPLPICVVIVGVLTIIYTFFGGIKSVVWNDCIQFVVYVTGGVLALLIIIQRLPEGWDQLIEFGRVNDKFRIFVFSVDKSETFTFWSGLVGGSFLALGTHGADQMMVQRYLCARNRQDAGRALICSGFVVLGQFALFLFLGVALAAFYASFPPAEAFARTDRVFTTFIVQELPAGVGLIGLILAAVFSAAMSTLSSSLNSSASSAVNDLYLPRLRQPASERHQLWASRVFTIFFGIVQIAVGIAGMYLATVIVNDVLAVAGFTSGVLLGLFALGVFVRNARQPHALVGLLTGVTVLTIVKFATSVAWPWYPLIGVSVTLSSGWLASLVWPARLPQRT
jgi:SSS family solute:Na+ symporter